MNQYYICAGCGAENEIDIDLAEGDFQHLTAVCEQCGRTNAISARYNYAVNEFELDQSADDNG